MRILAIVPYGDSYKNRFHFAYRQMEALEKHGVEVEIFELKSRFNPKVLILEYLRFLQVKKTFKPDIVHAHFGSMTSFFSVLNTLPKVVCFRGSDINHNPAVTPLRESIAHLLSHLSTFFAARVFCVSEEILSKLKCEKSKALIVPDGVNEAEFYPKSKSESRSKLGLDQTKKIILFNAGSNPRIKRFDLAEAVVQKVRLKYADLEFIVFRGDIPAEVIPDYMNAADVLLLTSDSEGSPVVVKEAASCGLPVVSFEVGDTKNILQDKRFSHVVKDRNLDEMASETIRLLTETSDLRTSYLPIEYSSEHISKTIIQQYKEITCAR